MKISSRISTTLNSQADSKFSSEHSSSKLKCRHKEKKRSMNKDAISQSGIDREKRHSLVDYKDSNPKEYARDSRKVYESKPEIYQEGKQKESKHDTYDSEKRKRTYDSKEIHHQDEKRMKYDKTNPVSCNYEEAYEEYKHDKPDHKRLCHKHKHDYEKGNQSVCKEPTHDSKIVLETKHSYVDETDKNDYKDGYYDEASTYDEGKLDHIHQEHDRIDKAASDIYQEEIREKGESIADAIQPRKSEVIELTPMVATVVEDELKELMIKFWQSLPDDPTDPAEELIVDQLNQEAGDDLRDTLGLNITQRMLDVNNQLILLIKMLSPDYTTSDRIDFAKKHRLTHFHRLRTDVYQARVNHWDHYEKFFKPRRWMCGNARCKITPLYDFTRCADNVKTVFDGSYDHSEAKKSEKQVASKLKQLEKPVLTADQVLAKSDKHATKTVEKKSLHTKTSNKLSNTSKHNAPKKTKAVTAKDVLSKSTDSVKSNTLSKGHVAKSGDNKTTGTPNKNVTKEPLTSDTKHIAGTSAVTPSKNIPELKKSDAKTKPIANSGSSPKVDETKKSEIKQSTAGEAKTIVKIPAKPVALVTASTDTVSAIVSKDAAKITPLKKEPAKTVAKETAKPVVSDSAKPTAKAPTTTVAMTPAKIIANTPKTIANVPGKTVPKEPATSATTVAKETDNTVATVPAKVIAKKPVKPDTAATTVVKETIKTVTKVPAKMIANAPTKTVIKKPAAIATTVTNETAKPVATAPVVKQPAKTDGKVSTQTVDNATTKAIAKPKMNTSNKESNTQTKTHPKQTYIGKASAKSPVKKAIESDFDELDDNDILSMLSGGIVLDECSGSDED